MILSEHPTELLWCNTSPVFKDPLEVKWAVSHFEGQFVQPDSWIFLDQVDCGQD